MSLGRRNGEDHNNGNNKPGTCTALQQYMPVCTYIRVSGIHELDIQGTNYVPCGRAAGNSTTPSEATVPHGGGSRGEVQRIARGEDRPVDREEGTQAETEQNNQSENENLLPTVRIRKERRGRGERL